MDKNILEYVGKSLYKTHILKEMKRYVVFRARVLCIAARLTVC